MKARAAVAWEPKKPLSIEEVDVEGPRERRGTGCRSSASGVCHTDAFTLSAMTRKALSLHPRPRRRCIVVECGPG